MEPVDAGQDFLVMVDYAHTPDSIQSVLRGARPLAAGRVIVVFGCGGDRDRAKRSPMGQAATSHADLTILTSDNPRSEDPLAIIAEIVRPAREAGGGDYVIEPDRRRAIAMALAEARPGDVVVIAGKGHETTQEVGGARAPVRRSQSSRGRSCARATAARDEAPLALRRRARRRTGMLLGDDVDRVLDRDRLAGGGARRRSSSRCPGRATDGHRFVTDAFERGAAAVLVRDGHRAPGPAVHVQDPDERALAARRRRARPHAGDGGGDHRRERQDLHEGHDRGGVRHDVPHAREPGARSTTRSGCP